MCLYCSHTGKLLLVKGTTFSRRAHPIFFLLIESLSNTVSLRACSKQILAMKDEYIKYEDFHHGRYRNRCCKLLSPLSRIVLENSGFITVIICSSQRDTPAKTLTATVGRFFLGNNKRELSQFFLHIWVSTETQCTSGMSQPRQQRSNPVISSTEAIPRTFN